jgi:hypothetical protein
MRIFVLAALFTVGFAFGAKKKRDWRVGRVVDAASTKSVYVSGSTTTAEASGTVSPDYGAGSTVTGTGTAQTRVHYTHVTDNDIIIVGQDYVFNIEDSVASGGKAAIALGHAIANRHHGCRFVVGEDVKYSQEKNKLYVLDADGKECKAEILRQERIQKPQPPVETGK